MSTRPMLRVCGLAKDYQGSGGAPLRAVEGVSFELPAGQVVCIVGGSGCGKSTLLGMVAGLDPASEGRMELDGVELEGPGADRGMVFQRDCLFPWLTVRQNVAFALGLAANRRLGRGGESRIDALIAEVGLAAFTDAYPRELSGGMRQRVAIARALVTRPKLLLLDEPFGALDAQTREQMQTLLLRVVREHGMTVLFVTHDVEEAVFLGDRVMVMQGRPGRVVAELAIDLPLVREPALKLDSHFALLRRRVLEWLQAPPTRSPASTSPLAHTGDTP